VPVVGVDSHLPAVPLAALQPAALRERFKQVSSFEPELMIEPSFVERALRDAAVLVPIVMHEAPTLLLTERTAELKNHAGQIAFAGGKVDETDANVQAAALREAWEEVGLAAEHVEVIGLMPHYITGTAFRITPVVALVRPGFSLKLNPAEVAQAFEVPLAHLMNPAHHQRHEVVWDFGDGPVKREWFSMPHGEHFIWGATAGMLRNLYRFLATVRP
jgi:8-oxo-dGTP pyrophosphatase MutT (NUDIX family)